MSGPEKTAGAADQTAGAATDPVEAIARSNADATPTAVETAQAAVGQATDTATENARAFVEEALQPPKAIEDVAAFTPRPGSPAAEPTVQDARAEAEAARDALAMEVGRLKERGREALDVKAHIKAVPAAIARDPRKAVGLGAAGAGAGLLLSRLRRGRRKAMPPGLLPAEVEAALEGIGPDADKIRDALESGFTGYLETYGARAARRPRRVPGLVSLFILPVASTAAREAIRRLAAGGSRKG